MKACWPPTPRSSTCPKTNTTNAWPRSRRSSAPWPTTGACARPATPSGSRPYATVAPMRSRAPPTATGCTDPVHRGNNAFALAHWQRRPPPAYRGHVHLDGVVPMNTRHINQRVRGIPASDGAGVSLTRVIGQPALDMLDPFLLLDEFGSDKPGDYIAGFPEHPHRGFETVTYMLDGRMRHGDNQGNSGLLTAGSVQWMTAGRGILHSEMPEQEEGLMRGFQLWVNLPAKDKKIGRAHV